MALTEDILDPIEVVLPQTISEDWSVLDTLPIALMKLSVDGLVLNANSVARGLLSMGAVGEQKMSDLIVGLGRPITDWIKDAAKSRVEKPEFVKIKGAQEDEILQIALHRMAPAQGPVWLLAVLNDATEFKALEAQFVQSQKMQAIGQLAGGVAHDFNNLLTAISGYCDLMLERHPSPSDPDREDLEQIHENADRAASLVSQLLAFSRKQRLKPEVLDLRDAMALHTKLLNRLVGEKVTLSLRHEDDLWPIWVDRRKFEQVVMNIVVNARDAMPDGGHVRITTRNVTLTKPLRRDRAKVPAGDYIIVKISDEGIGMSADHMQKIFEPFYTSKRQGEGTGLGLSTVYGIVKQTGGFVFVDSVVGKGSDFTLYMPAFSGEVMETDDRFDTQATRSKGTNTILLVEDEAPVRAFAARALKIQGYHVIEAECGEVALEMLSDPSLHVDVVISDVIMPGMDGPTWVRKALEMRAGLKVIFTSGYAEEDFNEQQERIPNSCFLPKPFSLSLLSETVKAQF